VTSAGQRFTAKDYGCLGIIVVVGLIASLPILANCGLLAYDFMFHFVANQHFAGELFRGSPYPRWLASMNGGFGSPMFFFYGPVAYFFTSLFHGLGGSGSEACRPLAMGSLLALVGSGGTLYLWLRGSCPPFAALAAACVYMLLPYHLSTNLYLRFAYAEFWAFVWMPLALYFARQLALGSARAPIGLAISLAVLAATHLPVFLIFAPVPIGYCLALAPRQKRLATLPALAGSYLLMAGLSAVYWIPAIATQDWVSMEEMKTSSLLYSNNFLSLSPSKGLRALQQLISVPEYLSLVVIGLATAIVVWLNATRLRLETLYFALVGVASVVMMLPASGFIWKALPVLQRIQFPTRFNAVLAVSLAAVVAFAATAIHTSLRTPYGQAWNQRWRGWLFLLSAFTLLMIQFAVLGNRSWQGEGMALIRIMRLMATAGVLAVFLPIGTKFPLRQPWLRLLIASFWLTTLLLICQQNYEQILSRRIDPTTSPFAASQIAAVEHFPKGISSQHRTPNLLLAWSARTPQARLLGSGGSTEVTRWQSRSIAVRVEAAMPDLLEIHQFHYPGWSARRLPGGEPLPVVRSDEGLLQVKLPAGRSDVHLELDAIRPEQIGWVITGLSSLAGLLFWRHMRSGPLAES
jgi:hypothetical protein